MQQDAVARDGLTDKTAAQFRQGSLIQQLWETNLEVFQRDRLALFGLIIFRNIHRRGDIGATDCPE